MAPLAGGSHVSHVVDLGFGPGVSSLPLTGQRFVVPLAGSPTSKSLVHGITVLQEGKG